MRQPKYLFILIALVLAPLTGGLAAAGLTYGLYPVFFDMDGSQFEIVNEVARAGRGSETSNNFFVGTVYGLLFLVIFMVPIGNYWNRKGTYSIGRFFVAGLIGTFALGAIAFFTTTNPKDIDTIAAIALSVGSGTVSALAYWFITRAPE